MFYLCSRQQTDSGACGVGSRHPALQPTGARGPGAAHQGILERTPPLRHRMAVYGS